MAIISVLLLWPTMSLAQTELSVEELVDVAVAALRVTSYEARMHFIAHYAGGEEQTVHIHHVAPDLYRITPLRKNIHGEWEEQGYYFIENADELVQVYEHDGKPDSVIEMPERSFYVNDAMTVKFLRDLARHPGTVLLDGLLGDTPVQILRQLAFREKPYTITVGLDVESHFPLYLLVNDGNHERRVFYEMKAIEYKHVDDIDPALLRVPELSEAKALKAPRTNQIAPSAITVHQSGLGESIAQVTVQRCASAAPEPFLEVDYALPLYPTWLPPGYQLEGIQLLDFVAHVEGATGPALVYQLLVYAPLGGGTLSIFQTSAEAAGFTLDAYELQAQHGYIMEPHNGWLVAVFGDLPPQELKQIVDGLVADDPAVSSLLELTQSRDRILKQALDSE